MNQKIRSLLAAAIALSLALPGMASADRRGHDRHDYGDRHGYKQSYGHNRHYRDRYPDYRGYRGYRGYPGYRGHYNRYDDDDLLTGLLIGGVLGYAINGARHSTPYYYYDR